MTLFALGHVSLAVSSREGEVWKMVLRVDWVPTPYPRCKLGAATHLGDRRINFNGRSITVTLLRVTECVLMSTPRKRSNVFTTIGKADLSRLVASSRSISHLFDQLQMRKSGASFKIFRRVAAEMEIDTSHFITHGNLTASIQKRTRPLDDVFADKSAVCNTTLRNKIIRHRLIPYQCAAVGCDNKGEWLGKPVVLQVDHINGARTDNRLENLRFLCPNCHSQTETFCGRRKKVQPRCPDCGKAYRGAGRRCRRCSVKLVKHVCLIQWPTNESLAKLVWEKSLSAVALDLKCSLTALRKQCKRKDIKYPPLGYWERLRRGYTHEQALVSQKRIRAKQRCMSDQDIEKAREIMTSGGSLRQAAKEVGFSHTTLMDRLEGDPVLLLRKRKKAATE